ncbi:MAG: DNA primase [Candidatus Andersenbacteria bacterium]
MSSETEQIKDRLEIAQIVGEYVVLKPAGRSLKGLCPFHNEKTPSFTVSPDRGTWHCFGACGEGGDIFTFIQKAEGLDFPATLKLLAERAGVQLKAGSPQSTNHRQRLFDVLSASARFYHQILMTQQAGRKAREYLLERGVTRETMELFQIGYAPDSWDVLQQWLRKHGFSDQEMIQSGAVGKSQRGKQYDRFRGRIIFPVQDTQGRVVAFGGRIVPWLATGEEGKYINSPEGPLYEKRRVVYNLNRAKQALRQNAPCIVVEGYMDTALLVQAGVQNVVATSGTAFTEEHITQLARFTKTLHFAFDGDAAGWKATVSATQAALAAGMTVATIQLPAGQDPADVVVKMPDKVQETMTHTESLMAVLLTQLKGSSNTTDRQQQLEAVLPLVRMVKNPIQQGRMIQEIADSLHVPETRVIDLIESTPASHIAAIQSSQEVMTMSEGGSSSLVERQVLGLLLVDTTVRADFFPYMEAEFFLDSPAVALYNSMQRIAEENAKFDSLSANELVGLLPPELLSYAEGVRSSGEELLSTTSLTASQEGRQLLRSLQHRSLRSRLQQLQTRLQQSGENERADALQEFRGLTEELAQIDS